MTTDIYKTAPSTTARTSTPALPAERGAAVELRTPRRRSFAFGQSDNTNMDFLGDALTADQAIFQAMKTMRSRAQTLERDNPHIRKFLIMVDGLVIGAKGIRLQSKAGDYVGDEFVADKLARRIIEAAFIDGSKKVHYSLDGRLGRRRAGQICLRRIFVDGEVIIRIHRGRGKYGIKYQLIDSEMLDHTFNQPAIGGKNEIKMGVELDADGAPAAYHFLKEAPPIWAGISAIGGDRVRVPASEIRHIYIQERPGQTRGFTWFISAGLRAKMLDGLERAVSVGYRVAASKMGFITMGEDYEGDEISTDDIPEDVAPGMIDILPKGASFEDFDPAYPNGDFVDLSKTMVRNMAAGLGVSYPSLGNDYVGVSYSAGQIGVGDDGAFWSNIQQFWIEEFEEPAAEDFLLMAITAGRIKLPIVKLEKFRNFKFQPPRRKPIDSLKTHNGQRVALGDMSRGPYAIAAENDQDFEDVVEEFKSAKQLLEDAGLPIPESWGGGVFLTAFGEEPPPPA